MRIIANFKNVSEADKSKAVEKLIEDSTPDFDFFLLMTLSFLMAAFGLLVDSVAVVIGSMLIAPILYPILSLSLGLVMSDFKLINRSLWTLGESILIGIGAAVIATLFFAAQGFGLSEEVLSRTNPSLLYFAIAVVSGLAVSYSLVKGNLSETLPGIAVSVALLPPLAVVGIGIAYFNWQVIAGASVLFLISLVGIVFASMLSFSLMDLYGKRPVAQSAIEKEEERVEQEKEQVEQKVAEEKEQAEAQEQAEEEEK